MRRVYVRHRGYYEHDRQAQIAAKVYKNRLVKAMINMDFSSNESKFKKLDECIICFEQFQPGDQITPLSHNLQHYFHSQCIEGWLLHGNESCPICRHPVTAAQERQFQTTMKFNLKNDIVAFGKKEEVQKVYEFIKGRVAGE